MSGIPSTFYAVIYGQSHEDIMYFTDITMAIKKLEVQKRNVKHFMPYVITYQSSDIGVYVREKMIIN